MKSKAEKRIRRLLQIITEVQTSPRQTVSQLHQKLGIGRSQFYKDKELLKSIGFDFEYSRSQQRFVLVKDGAFLPVESLSLSERLALIMAFRQLSAAGDYVLSYAGFQAARKLALGLPAPFRESLFADIVLAEGFGCQPGILDELQKAVESQQRVILWYQRPDENRPQAHEVELYHIFFRRRALYTEGYSWTEKGIRMYRLNRIQKVKFTGMGFRQPQAGYDFAARHKNAFSAFPGEHTETVVVRFSPRIRPFIQESRWHPSQQITPEPNGFIRFEVEVAEPREVMWWALGWGSGAEIVAPAWLREMAGAEAEKMCRLYKRP